MKNFIKILTLVFVVVACSSPADEPMLVQEEPFGENLVETISGPTRSQQEAVSAARNAINRLFAANSRSGATKEIASVKAIVSTMSRSNMSDTLIYVVNFADENGFVMVSAPRTADEILAVVETGNYDPEEGTDNPGFNYFLDCAVEYVTNISAVGLVTGDSISSELRPSNPDGYVTFKEIVDTLAHWGGRDNYALKIHWNQTGVFGKYCPNGIAGCGPVAIGTIAAHLNYLTVGKSLLTYNFPERDVDSDSITWQQFMVHDRENPNGSLSCWEKDKIWAHNAIGRMLRQIGYDCGSDYKTSSTSTLTGVCGAALKKYVPAATSVSNYIKFDSKKVMRDIDKGLLFMVSQTKENLGGHAWVADGYDYTKVAKTRLKIIRNLTTNNVKIETVSTDTIETSFTSFKWGWGGTQDGYFANNVFEVGPYTFNTPQYISVKIRE